MYGAHGRGMEDQADARGVVALPFRLEDANEMRRDHLRPGHGMLLNEREASLAGEAVLDNHPATFPPARTPRGTRSERCDTAGR